LAEIGIDYYVYNQAGDPFSVKKIDLTKAKIALNDAKKSTEDMLRTSYNSVLLLEDSNKNLIIELDKAQNDLKLVQSNVEVGLATQVNLDKALLNVKSIEQQLLENTFDYNQLIRSYLRPWTASGTN